MANTVAAFLNISRTLCGLPEADHRDEAKVTSLAMFGVATVFFACRLAVKVLRFSSWGFDDSLMVVAYVCPCSQVQMTFIH